MALGTLSLQFLGFEAKIMTLTKLVLSILVHPSIFSEVRFGNFSNKLRMNNKTIMCCAVTGVGN